ncbi:hypothetical protein [Mycolicibacterium chubuense]|uniref:Uncharacterized protein n=1 Tax=Mycolicibacterium chubuense TaxID=1800 RepID=A0A0J6WIR6_MYCCU|nr:hypothetical protein [Mycolicibacterium chubuense]KMO81602.1 hypothetical protein MCHUDSM44219_01956 [Mycolicibacterium chubuense]SPX95828.1 Uncharacterised protein [Mycolicibacterium chubuense]
MMFKLIAASGLAGMAVVGAVALTVAPGQTPSGPYLTNQSTVITTTSSPPTYTGRPGY